MTKQNIDMSIEYTQYIDDDNNYVIVYTPSKPWSSTAMFEGVPTTIKQLFPVFIIIILAILYFVV